MSSFADVSGTACVTSRCPTVFPFRTRKKAHFPVPDAEEAHDRVENMSLPLAVDSGTLWSRCAKRSTTLVPPRSKTRTATDFRYSRP